MGQGGRESRKWPLARLQRSVAAVLSGAPSGTQDDRASLKPRRGARSVLNPSRHPEPPDQPGPRNYSELTWVPFVNSPQLRTTYASCNVPLHRSTQTGIFCNHQNERPSFGLGAARTRVLWSGIGFLDPKPQGLGSTRASSCEARLPAASLPLGDPPASC